MTGERRPYRSASLRTAAGAVAHENRACSPAAMSVGSGDRRWPVTWQTAAVAAAATHRGSNHVGSPPGDIRRPVRFPARARKGNRPSQGPLAHRLVRVSRTNSAATAASRYTQPSDHSSRSSSEILRQTDQSSIVTARWRKAMGAMRPCCERWLQKPGRRDSLPPADFFRWICWCYAQSSGTQCSAA